VPGGYLQKHEGRGIDTDRLPGDAPKTGMTVEAYEAPPRVIANVERIMEAAGIEVGGVEICHR